MSSREGRPQIEIPFQKFDWILEIICALLVIAVFAIPYYYYGQLPDTIPTHYNAAGEPDDFGPKSSIWWLPNIAVALYFFITFVNLFPEIFNYMEEITIENAEAQYRLMTRFMRILKILTVTIFLMLTIKGITTALGSTEGLGAYFIFAIVGFFMILPFCFHFLSKNS